MSAPHEQQQIPTRVLAALRLRTARNDKVASILRSENAGKSLFINALSVMTIPTIRN